MDAHEPLPEPGRQGRACAFCIRKYVFAWRGPVTPAGAASGAPSTRRASVNLAASYVPEAEWEAPPPSIANWACAAVPLSLLGCRAPAVAVALAAFVPHALALEHAHEQSYQWADVTCTEMHAELRCTARARHRAVF